jgi:SAM-dependent methyltransferase
MDALTKFITELKNIENPKVLELGTGRWKKNVPTHHGEWVPEGGTHVKSDIFQAEDVDVIADAHDLAPFKDNEFDAFMAISVWEHLKKPWLAAEAARRVLRPGGILLVQTHFVFPVHGYPSDYCRWTDEGLKGLFDEPEWSGQIAGMQYPCVITPPKEVTTWNTAAPAFLNVNIFAVKN